MHDDDLDVHTDLSSDSDVDKQLSPTPTIGDHIDEALKKMTPTRAFDVHENPLNNGSLTMRRYRR